MKVFLNYVLTFFSWNAIWKTLLIFTAFYVVIALILLIAMGIRRKTKRWRHKTIQDILRFKFVAVSYWVTSSIFMVFLPYIAIPLWVGAYWVLTRKLFHRDMMVMADLDEHSLYEKHPFHALNERKNIANDGQAVYGWAQILYLCMGGLSVIPTIGLMCFEPERVFPKVLLIIIANIVAICTFVSYYILFHLFFSRHNDNPLTPIIVFIAILVIVNVLLIGG